MTGHFFYFFKKSELFCEVVLVGWKFVYTQPRGRSARHQRCKLFLGRVSGCAFCVVGWAVLRAIVDQYLFGMFSHKSTSSLAAVCLLRCLL